MDLYSNMQLRLNTSTTHEAITRPAPRIMAITQATTTPQAQTVGPGPTIRLEDGQATLRTTVPARQATIQQTARMGLARTIAQIATIIPIVETQPGTLATSRTIITGRLIICHKWASFLYLFGR